MKEKRNNSEITYPCVGCKFSTKASEKDLICNRPGQTSEEAVAAVIDTFFGEVCKCYQPTNHK